MNHTGTDFGQIYQLARLQAQALRAQAIADFWRAMFRNAEV